MSVPLPFVLLDRSLDGRGSGEILELDEATRRHLQVVLRLGDGAGVEVADGAGRTAAAAVDGDGLVLRSVPRVERRSGPAMHVLQGLPKGRKIDDVVRHLTELDVDRITLVVAERTIGRADAERRARLWTRLAEVARAACQQSRRARLPDIDGPVSLGEVALPASLLVAHPGHLGPVRAGPAAPTEGAEPMVPLPAAIASLHGRDELAVAVGPEGGWAPAEIDAMRDAGGRLVSLGPTVLRTEHAAAAAVAVLASATGRWRLAIDDPADD